MPRKTLLVTTLALLLGGAASIALAQTTPPPSGATPATTAQKTAHGGRAMHHRDMGMRYHQRNRGEHGGVMGSLRALERLYRDAGRTNELNALYNDVLAKSQNPRVRNYVYMKQADLQARPANVDQAIGTLRKALDENLANEAKMRTERESRRSQWQPKNQPSAPVSIPPPADAK